MRFGDDTLRRAKGRRLRLDERARAREATVREEKERDNLREDEEERRGDE